MSPFYAAYVRQLQSKPGYASGGTVQPGIVNKATATPNAADTQLGGPSGNAPYQNMNTAGYGKQFRNLGTTTGQIEGAPVDYLTGGKTQLGKESGKLYGNVVGSIADGILGPLTNNFQAQAAPIQAGTNIGQLQQAYDQAQSGIQQQQGLVDQLGQQNGIQNQSDVYGQLGQMAQGLGPNPAQAMLQQQTGQNIATQAALMASQRGASANPAAIARQAAQQGAATQQNAVGQGAALQAQQSANAINSQANIAGQQVANQVAGVQGLNNATQNEQNILQGANTSFNNAQVAQQGGINSANAQTAAANQNANGQVFGGIAKGISSVAAAFSDENGKKNFESADFDIDAFLDSLHKPNMAEGGEVDSPTLPQQTEIAPPQSSTGQWLNSQVSDSGPNVPEMAAIAPMKWDLVPSPGGGGGMMAQGGQIEDTVEAKSYDYKDPSQQGAAEGRQYGITAQDLEKSPAGKSVVKDTPQGKMIDSTHTIGLLLASVGRLNERIKGLESGNKMAKGGQVDAMVSPGERYLDKEDVGKVKKGKSPMKVGQAIPGKAKVSGAKDSYANDNVSKKLQVGGIVLPRSVTQGPNAEAKAHKFVESIFMHKPNLKKKRK